MNMWVCQTPGCNANHADTMVLCPHCKGESPALQEAKKRAVTDALAAKAVAAQLDAEAAAKAEAQATIDAAVKAAIV